MIFVKKNIPAETQTDLHPVRSPGPPPPLSTGRGGNTGVSRGETYAPDMALSNTALKASASLTARSARTFLLSLMELLLIAFMKTE